ncbi:MetQ/NlpA family ABC transporter substrate-binding protein [Staphylococcus gallinarum]|jgi:D-methionine transport system substrate-binding protein|uniref:MetQ/NlpA family ABC transporter substrate-binding protein n=1 Tax=Staphylococcus gallinarum TaxID=1293 RepID=UPI000E692FDE|nr:MetQ/NlpA family ABC transporter substrate-binding protein [Staphylococcus gallinarum]MCD8872189.1 MetQ/NlpA family ABC transporter substrate-binding protein [Staphylococcus gallinarum]MCQ9289248.1 MetQ/NlpA family ABC transporter substrate-binding protein [Staphylococcus gallinarum]MCW0984421.1 MetQ/NlpA family ABC transporter substrate-binding protein [Staphylococcus gallinarum]RIO83656.1 MetQ/NlpA family ABC transporter substrate-binding protein [Staphylococcus gallinarum]
MKKLFSFASVLVLALVLAACGNGGGKDKTITVGASPAPHAEILEKAKPLLKDKGYNLKIKTINDYTTPNKLLNKGELDANFFQHTPYLKTDKKDKGYKIESAGNVHLEPMAVYSKKYKSLKDLPKGATVYVSNNPAEEGRFLKFFVDEGLIKLKKGVKPEDATFKDITENKKDIKFNNKQSAEYLPKIYQNQKADAVIINSNFAIDQKLSPQKDSMVVEKAKDNPYANLIAVKEGHKDDKKIKALMEVLHSKEIKDYINKKYDGAVVPAK